MESGAQEQLIFKHAISTISQSRRATGELHPSPATETHIRQDDANSLKPDCSFTLSRTKFHPYTRICGWNLYYLRGYDGSGKSTQLPLSRQFLKELGCQPLTTREPGGTAIGSRLRAALLDAEEQVDPLTELLVFAADRAQHVRRVLRPALEAGQVVISDRYADATVAYQGAGGDLNPAWFRK